MMAPAIVVVITGLLVKVTDHTHPHPKLWVVATDDPDYAVETVRSLVDTGCEVEVTDYRLGLDTMSALRLKPGEARAL